MTSLIITGIKLDSNGIGEMLKSKGMEDELMDIAERRIALLGLPNTYEARRWNARKRAAVNVVDTRQGGLNREARYGRLRRFANGS